MDRKPRINPALHCLLAAGGLAAVAVPHAGAAAPLSFDCDVPAGRSSSVSAPAGPAPRIVATITPATLRFERVAPSAGVSLSSADGRNVIGFRLVLPRADATSLQLSLVGRADGKNIQPVALREVPRDGKVRVTLAVDANGNGQVSFDDKTSPIRFAAPGGGTVTAFCGSGQFRFDGLELGAP